MGEREPPHGPGNKKVNVVDGIVRISPFTRAAHGWKNDKVQNMNTEIAAYFRKKTASLEPLPKIETDEKINLRRNDMTSSQ